MEVDDDRPEGSGTRSEEDSGLRDSLKRRLFRRCDEDADGRLNKREMKTLARFVGFEGLDPDWDEEYLKLCKEFRIPAGEGVPESIAMQLLDDQSASGCFVTNEEMQEQLETDGAASAVAAKSQGSAVEEVARGRRGTEYFNIGSGPPSEAAASQGAESRRSESKRSEASRLGVVFQGANPDTGAGELRRAFSEAGDVEDLRLCRGGSGSVRFVTDAEARHAVLLLDGREVDGQKLTVKQAILEEDSQAEPEPRRKLAPPPRAGRRRSRTPRMQARSPRISMQARGPAEGRSVFFAGASPDTSEGRLREYLESAGQVEKLWIFRNNSLSRGMGLALYATSDEAEEAVASLDGRSFDNSEIMVRPDEPERMMLSSEGPGGAYRRGRTRASTSYVFFAGTPASATQEELQCYFEGFGPTLSLNLFYDADGNSRGMGIVRFATTAGATEALSRGLLVEGKRLHLQEDEKRRPATRWSVAAYQNGDGSSWRARSRHLPEPEPGSAVSFANVPTGVTETYLRKRFAAFGQVKTLTLYSTKGGISRGEGIVEYLEVKAAEWAIAELGDKKIGGQYISLQAYA